jgi:hypothetical protein
MDDRFPPPPPGSYRVGDTLPETAPRPEHKPQRADPERWKGFLPSGWNALDLPPRDWLLQDLLSTTSRWLVVGETGVGKTLLLLEMAHAMSKGVGFLNWQGVDWRQHANRKRPFRIMYLDGELPAETMKERIAEASRFYGTDLEVVVYNRDRLGLDELPPLNTEPGREWLKAEIEAVEPDCIILDNIMALLSGKMDDEQWEAVKPLIAWIMARRCAQIWVHHPGHDTSRGFGTKTREWHMDAVINLTREGNGDDGDGDRIRLKFTKARMKRPETAHLYRELIIRRTAAGRVTEAAPRKADESGSKSDILQAEILKALDDLQEGAPVEPGFNGAPVRKVRMTLVADYLKRRGALQTKDEDDPDSGITNADRQALSKARLALKRKGKIAMLSPYMWRV